MLRLFRHYLKNGEQCSMIDSPSLNVPNKPWSKRASISARKTYSAESSIVYKRRKHMFSIKDLERISKKLDERMDENTPEEQSNFWQKLLNFLKNRTIAMLKVLLTGLGLDWAADAIYDFIHSMGSTIIDNPNLDQETKDKLWSHFNDFTTALWGALQKLTRKPE